MEDVRMKIKARENFKSKLMLTTLLTVLGVILLFFNKNSVSGVETMTKNYEYSEEYYLSVDEKERLIKIIKNAVNILLENKEPSSTLFGEEWIMTKQGPVLDRYYNDGLIGIRWFRSSENAPWDRGYITLDKSRLFTSVPEDFFSDALNLKLENITRHKTTVIEVDSNDNDIEVEKPYLSYNYKPLKKNGVLISFIVMGNEQEKYPINFIRVEIKKIKQS